MEQITTYLLEQGPLGLITLAVTYGYWKKDRQLERYYEQDRERSHALAKAAMILEDAHKLLERGR